MINQKDIALKTKKINTIFVIAGVRYYIDCDYSTDNGVTWNREDDTDDNCEKMKTIIPLIKRTNIGYSDYDYWCLEIDYETGKVKDWPENFCIKTFFKVCDDGLYQILSTSNEIIWDSDKAQSAYVPAFLEVENSNYGDNIYINIDGDGIIEHWNIAKLLINDLINN